MLILAVEYMLGIVTKINYNALMLWLVMSLVSAVLFWRMGNKWWNGLLLGILLPYLGGLIAIIAYLFTRKERKTMKLISSIENENIDKIRSLLKSRFLSKPADVNNKVHDEKIALIIATKKGNVKIVKLLLDAGADANLKDKDQKTALMYANNLSIVEMLIKSGGDVNANVEVDKTVLMMAIENGNSEIVKLLLGSGANVNAKTKDSKKVYDQNAWKTGSFKTHWLEDKTALILAVEQGSEMLVNMILDKKPDIDFKNRYGETALIKALKKNNEKIIKILVHAGAKMNLSELIYHIPPSSKSEFYLKIIKLFLDSGAEVNAI